jgi:hypothetical protein
MATVLSAGQDAPMFRHGAEKYSKFAYSTAAPPCVEARDAQFGTAALDGSMAVEAVGRPWQIRSHSRTIRQDGRGLRVQWRPYDDVIIDSWLRFAGTGHVRIHRVRSAVDLRLIEGGFASARACLLPHAISVWDDSGRAMVANGGGIADLRGERKSRVHVPAANLSLLTPKVEVPQLLGFAATGVSWFASFVSLNDLIQTETTIMKRV